MNIGQKLEKISMEEDLFPELSSAEKMANKLLAKVAQQIYDRRKQLHMTQKDLADQLRVSQPMVSQWESGECNFSVESLASVFDSLGLSVDFAFTPVEQIYKDITWNTDNDLQLGDYWTAESEAA